MRTLLAIAATLSVLTGACAAQPAQGSAAGDRIQLFLLDLAEGRSAGEALERARREAIWEARGAVRGRQARRRLGAVRGAGPAETSSPAGMSRTATPEGLPGRPVVVGRPAPGLAR